METLVSKCGVFCRALVIHFYGVYVLQKRRACRSSGGTRQGRNRLYDNQQKSGAEEQRLCRAAISGLLTINSRVRRDRLGARSAVLDSHPQ